MGEENIGDQGEMKLVARTSGEQLRLARERMGLSLKDVADRTRISARQIEMIEAGDLGGLPGKTYAIGFSRSYAKLVGEDEETIIRMVRAELAQIEPDPAAASHHFEPGDPARVPARGLAWPLAIAALLLLAGGYAFYRTFVSPAASYPAVEMPQDKAAASASMAAAPVEPEPAVPAGAVVFTAREAGIWVKFYDRNGRQLMQKQMELGESYTVPADADGPQVWTGRPDALAITIGGTPVAPLADGERVVRDVPVTAEALLARETAPQDAAASPTT